MKVRRELRWALSIAVLLTAIALIWAPTANRPLQDVSTRTAAATSASSAAVAHRSGAGSSPALRLEQAQVDIFAPPALTVPPVPKAPAPIPTPPSLAIAPPPPPPMATPPRPPASPRFAGRMRTPEGETLIYLRDGEQTILAKPGLALSSGYIVVSLLPAPAASGAGAGTIVAVRLFHAASQHHEELRLPSDNEPR